MCLCVQSYDKRQTTNVRWPYVFHERKAIVSPDSVASRACCQDPAMSKHPLVALRCVALRCNDPSATCPKAATFGKWIFGFLQVWRRMASRRTFGDQLWSISSARHTLDTVQAIPVTIYSKGYRTIEKARVQCR